MYVSFSGLNTEDERSYCLTGPIDFGIFITLSDQALSSLFLTFFLFYLTHYRIFWEVIDFEILAMRGGLFDACQGCCSFVYDHTFVNSQLKNICLLIKIKSIFFSGFPI